MRDGAADGLLRAPEELVAGREADEARDVRRGAVLDAQGLGAPHPVDRARAVWLEEGMRERDVSAESMLSALSGQAAGVNAVFVDSLDRFADARAWPGGVREDLDAVRELSEELADGRNYCLWGLEPLLGPMTDGDSDAGADYARLMRALGHVQQAWAALHGG